MGYGSCSIWAASWAWSNWTQMSAVELVVMAPFTVEKDQCLLGIFIPILQWSCKIHEVNCVLQGFWRSQDATIEKQIRGWESLSPAGRCLRAGIGTRNAVWTPPWHTEHILNGNPWGCAGMSSPPGMEHRTQREWTQNRQPTPAGLVSGLWHKHPEVLSKYSGILVYFLQALSAVHSK